MHGCHGLTGDSRWFRAKILTSVRLAEIPGRQSPMTCPDAVVVAIAGDRR